MPLFCQYHNDPTTASHGKEISPELPEGLLESMKSTVSTVLDFILEQREDVYLDKAIAFQSIRYGSLVAPIDFRKNSLEGPFQILLWNSPMSLRRTIERLQDAIPDLIFNPLLIQKVKKCVSFSL